MKLSLRKRLIRYLLKHHGWVSSGELQKLVSIHTKYTPRTAVRRLEELAECGMLRVEYRKGHAFYRGVEDTPLKKMEQMVREFDLLP